MSTRYPPDCGDNSCMFADKKGGMRTNGGCRCWENASDVERRRLAQWLAQERRRLMREVAEWNKVAHDSDNPRKP